MIVPQRVQRSRRHKLESPNGLPVVCVDRSTQWGNPFKVGSEYITPEGKTAIMTAEVAVELFTSAIAAASNKLHFHPSELWKLRGKNLACWCALADKEGNPVPCHATILLQLSNLTPEKGTDNDNIAP